LQRCYKLSDIAPIGELENLEHLEITYSDALVDIRPIGKFKKLKLLKLTGCSNIKDVSILINCTNLEELHLGDGIDPKTIYFIKDLNKLKVFSGTNNETWKIIEKIRPDLM